MDCICTYGGIPEMDEEEEMTYIGGRSKLMRIPVNTTFEEFMKMMGAISSNNPNDLFIRHFVGGLNFAVDEDTYRSLFTFVKRNPEYNPFPIWIVTNNNPSNTEPSSSSLAQRNVVMSNSANWETHVETSLESSNSDGPRVFSSTDQRCNSSPLQHLSYDVQGKAKEEHREVENEVVISKILPSAEKNINMVLEWLGQEDVHYIGIQGEDGVGTTWTAKQVADRAAASANPFDVVIWLRGSSKHKMQIVDQLKLFSVDQWKWFSNTNENPDIMEKNLRMMISDSLTNKRFLLIADDLSADYFDPEELGVPLPKEQNRSSKILLIGIQYTLEESGVTFDRVLSVDTLPENEAWLLFRQKAGLEHVDSPVVKELAETLLLECNGRPLDIIMVAGVLKKSEGTWEDKLRNAILERKDRQGWELVLYQMLPSKVMKDCMVYSTLYARHCRIRAKELITAWILEGFLEGFLDGFNCVEIAYEKGHYILKELVDRNLLFMLDEDHVTVHKAMWSWFQCLKRGNNATFSSAFHQADLFEKETAQLMPSTLRLMNGNFQTKYSDEDNAADHSTSLSTLLIHGNEGCPLVELTDDCFEQVQNLKVLSVLHAKISAFPTSFSNLKSLRVLVLRGSEIPENLECIQGLHDLVRLSISCANTLKNLPDDFFENLLHLECLDLSHTPLKRLPKSLTEIYYLQYLTLRGCSSLEYVPFLESLEVLNLSDASSLKTIADEYFSSESRLLELDISGTYVDKLTSVCTRYPIELRLRECSRITTLPSPIASYIRLIDLSGASAFEGFKDGAFGEKNIFKAEVIDLSETQIVELPFLSRCLSLRKLILRNCLQLKKLPRLRGLEELDVSNSTAFQNLDVNSCFGIQRLNLSGTRVAQLPIFSNFQNLRQLLLRDCVCLKKIKDGDFNLPNLHILDLSGTHRLEKLPDLSNCSSLQQLLLRNCSSLNTLPQLTQLERLQVLDLSGATAISQPEDEYLKNNSELRELNLSRIPQMVCLPSLSKCSNLRKLILKGCSALKTLPTLEALTRLKMLDLSDANSFTGFHDKSFGEKRNLKIIDISRTQIIELPILSGCLNLCQLLLRDCSNLARLPHLQALTKLEVLDLSGATALSQLNDKCFDDKCGLQQLDLSGNPHVEKLPFLSGCSNLSELTLRGCTKLKALPSLEALTRLKVIDLSGATSFTEFQDDTLGQKYDLQILDLSETRIAELPLLSGCINLCQLLLRDCGNLQTLPHLKALTRLEVLDLRGNTALTQLQDESFEQKNELKVLNLSRTKVTEFSFLSHCNNLRQLSLQQCSNIDKLSFGSLYLLQKLDLSETDIKDLPPSITKLRNLSDLILKGCTNLETLPLLEVLTKLEVLDLSGTQAGEFPCDISKFIHLRFFAIQNRKYVWLDEWENQMEIAKVLKWDLCGGSSSSSDVLELTTEGAVDIGDFGENSRRFHFCLSSVEEWGKEEDFYLQGKESVISKIYYQSSQLPEWNEPNNFLKICGFRSFPNGIKMDISPVELLYLKKNAFITRLSDVGEAVRECWIERCHSIESVFYEEDEEENVVLGRNLQAMWLSNLSKLRSLYQGEVQPSSFTKLKHLYIDCCPSLINIFSSGIELQNLETLKIKFCDKFESVFGVLEEHTLPKLHKLTLWRLPAVHSICGGVLPSLKHLQIRGCPNLRKLPLDSASQPVEIKGEQKWWDNLNWANKGVISHLRFTPSPHYL